MSKAFTKEDTDPPERSGRVRSASGLPPGATNYITACGAERLQQELTRLLSAGEKNEERIIEIEAILKSVTIVEPPKDAEPEIGFGARVTVSNAVNQLKSYRIVGAEELDLYSDSISWISLLGKTLLAAKLGDRVVLSETDVVKIVKVEYPAD